MMHDENKEELMTLPCSYEELVKALQCNGKDFEDCMAEECPYLGEDGWCDEDKMRYDAADAIEKLIIENK